MTTKMYAIGLCLFLAFGLSAQELSLGLKGGFTLANQSWDGADRQTLPTFHAVGVLESRGKWNTTGNIPRRSGFRMELGYRQRGSAIRTQFNRIGSNDLVRQLRKNQFHHISLVLAAKGEYKLGEQAAAYYIAGVNLGYNFNDSLLFTGLDMFVNDFTAGALLGGGAELSLGAITLFGEVSIFTDFTRQIYVPVGVPFTFVDGSGRPQQVSYPEQRVTNLALELSMGIRMQLQQTEAKEEFDF